jgi:hypothetical protein
MSPLYLNAYVMKDGRLSIGVVDAENELTLCICEPGISEAEEKTKLSAMMKLFYDAVKAERTEKTTAEKATP